MKSHTICQPRRGDSHANRRNPARSPSRWVPAVHKVPADSVPYGDSISRNGETVWAAYDGERLLCVAATAGEARRKGHAAMQRAAMQRAEGAGQNLED